VLAWQQRTETASEIAKMESALKLARTKYGDAPFLPSHLILLNDTTQYKNPSSLLGPGNKTYGFTAAQVAAVQQTKTAFRFMFGRRFAESGGLVNWVPDYTTDPTGATPLANGWTELWGGECLTFYLGGMPIRPPGTVKGGRGFSSNPTDPTSPSGTDTLGPFFEFKANRLGNRSGQEYYMYADPYGIAYAFFGPIGPNLYSSDCPFTKGADGVGVDPYYDSNQGKPFKFFNPNLFQIISAGPDRCFGAGGPWDPRNGSIGTTTSDNLVNFSQTQLSEPQQ